MVSYLLAVLLSSQEPSVEDLIRSLRSEKIEERNKAGLELKRRGEAVIPSLEKASKDSSVELSNAAKELILDIKDPLHGETVEETYKKMDDAIRSAKTIRVVLRSDFTRAEEKPTYAKMPGGVLLVKGAKVCMEPIDPAQPGAENMSLVCDGSTVMKMPKYTPAMFREDLLSGLTRAGLIVTLYVGSQIRRAPDEDLVTLSPAKPKGNDALGRMIAYQATFSDREVLDVVLWVDLKTRLPVQIIASTRGEGQNCQHWCEKYESWVLGGEIPDEKFKLPPAAPVEKPDVYPGTDVVEPKEFELKRALGMKKADGLLETGTLEYGGAGDLAKIYDTYVVAMKSVGWQGVANNSGNDKLIGTLRKGERICTIEFTKVATGIQAVIKVGPGK